MNEFPVDGGNVKSKVPTGDGEDMSLWVTVEIEGCVFAEGSDTKGRIPVVGGTLMPLWWGTPGGGGGH